MGSLPFKRRISKLNCLFEYALYPCLLQPEQYADWLAAFRLASRRRTMADVSYTSEVQSILDLLHLRQPAGHLDLDKLPFADLDPDNFAAAGCVRKVGRRQVGNTNIGVA